jgi:hypothetical protein
MSRRHYDAMREFIIASFGSASEVSFSEIVHLLSEDAFDLPVETALWYLIKVKQDLQVRGIVKVSFIGVSPRIQLLRLNRKALKRPIIPY